MHCNSPKHLDWLRDTGDRITTADGKTVEVWEFCHQPDVQVLSAWAKHFRNHYCTDSEIDYLRRGYNHSRSDYLTIIKFPDKSIAPGPSIRAGDFGEILIADYLEYVLGFWVPRVRYGLKAISNESSKGCDTLGFLLKKDGEESPSDILAIYETKARFVSDQLTDGKKLSGFQAAINDSAKDRIRVAESLNFLKQRLFEKGNVTDADRVERFQNLTDHPYVQKYGAAALYSIESFISETITNAVVDKDGSEPRTLHLIIVKGTKLMELVHELYRRAADEA